MILLGADGEAEHQGQALWRGDAEGLLRDGQWVDEDGTALQTTDEQTLFLCQLQTADLS